MDIYDQAAQVATKEDFVVFLRALKNHLSSSRDEWENDNLESYLEGLYGYCLDLEDHSPLTWKIVAKMLLAAIVYE